MNTELGSGPETEAPQGDGMADRGAGMVEYALLVAFIGLVLVVAIGFLTTQLDGSFRDAASAF